MENLKMKFENMLKAVAVVANIYEFGIKKSYEAFKLDVKLMYSSLMRLGEFNNDTNGNEN